MKSDLKINDSLRGIVPPCGKGVKGWIKYAIFKIVWWLLQPLYEMAANHDLALLKQEELIRKAEEKNEGSLALLQDKMSYNNGVLEEQGKELINYRVLFKEQCEALAEHGEALAKHDGALAEHGETLAKQGGALAKHGGVLAEHGEVLAKHGGVLAEHDGALVEYGEAIKKLDTSINDYSHRISEDIAELEERFTGQNKNYSERFERTGAQLEELNSVLTELGNEVTRQNGEIDTHIEQRFSEAVDISDLRLQSLHKEQESFREKVEHELERRDDKIGAVSRELMKVKWRQIDEAASKTETPEDVLTCTICGASHKRKEYETKISACIFNGGKLVRYVCPDCGVTFGPTKFSGLTQKEKDEDYVIHYLGFNEVDYHDKELRAFHMLKPSKNGVYLDYGCGKWSHTVEMLRKEGYNVYGFEPYAGNDEEPYIISDKNALTSMRFDGIFSNDLLEHLIDPVEDMKFMKTLLRDPRSKIAHSTTCYEYVYEFTRFHTHFFTGRSNEVLAERTGFEILEYVNELHDENKESDFICCLYGVKDKEIRYNENMGILGEGGRGDDGEIILESGATMYGPYLFSPEGSYRWHIVLDCAAELAYKVTADKGGTLISEGVLAAGDNLIEYILGGITEDVEIIIHNDSAGQIKVKLVALR